MHIFNENSYVLTALVGGDVNEFSFTTENKERKTVSILNKIYCYHFVDRSVANLARFKIYQKFSTEI